MATATATAILSSKTRGEKKDLDREFDGNITEPEEQMTSDYIKM